MITVLNSGQGNVNASFVSFSSYELSLGDMY